MKYNEIWEAVDKLAMINGLTPSGLAKKAGLDPTVFNKSKRVRPDGKKRWPSLDSINKITSACHISFEDFYHILDETGDINGVRGQFMLPLYKLDNVSSEPVSYINFPDLDAEMYAVLVDDNSYDDIYPFGSVLILSDNAQIKKGNKVIITLKNEQKSVIGQFISKTANGIKITKSDGSKKISLSINDIEKISRIMWVSQ